MQTNKPWQVLARRVMYGSDWISIQTVDVKLPDGSVMRDIHLVDYAREATGVLAVDEQARILLVDHYRFQTDTRGWEIPAGGMEPGEIPEQTAARELAEETGHRAALYKRIMRYHPSNGSSNQVFNLVTASGVERTGSIQDTNEVMDCRWFRREEVMDLVAKGEILDGFSITGLLWYLTFQNPGPDYGQAALTETPRATDK